MGQRSPSLFAPPPSAPARRPEMPVTQEQIEAGDEAACKLDGMFRDLFNQEDRQDIVRVILTAALGDCVVVPREPTGDMCECGPLIGETSGGRTPAITTSQADEVYRAMIAAAPSPPSNPAEGRGET